MDQIVMQAKAKMDKSCEMCVVELSKIRTGRASPGFLDHVRVPSYGSEVPLSQVATVNAPDARTLIVTPWDKTLLAAVEKAILSAGLGLNPQTQGNSIRVPMPALTEERRKDFVKMAKQVCEEAKVAIRHIRQHARDETKELSENEQAALKDQIEKEMKLAVAHIDQLFEKKQTDLLEV